MQLISLQRCLCFQMCTVIRHFCSKLWGFQVSLFVLGQRQVPQWHLQPAELLCSWDGNKWLVVATAADGIAGVFSFSLLGLN